MELKENLVWIVDWVQDMAGVSDWFGELWSDLVEGASNIWQESKRLGKHSLIGFKYLERSQRSMVDYWADIVGIVQIPWTLITSLIQAGINIIVGIFDVSWTVIRTQLGKLLDTISDSLKNTWIL